MSEIRTYTAMRLPVSRHAGRRAPREQRGVILFVALILLAILSLLGVTMARMQTVEERMAGNDQNHNIALQSAEAALRTGEGFIYNGTITSTQCVANNAGAYQFDPVNQPNAYINSVNGSPWNPAGAFTYAGPALGTAQAPQFIIECLPPVAPKCQSSASWGYGSQTPPIATYRITALSSGADGNARSELQSIVSGVCQ